MTVRAEFLFIAGDAALDFVNTEIVREGKPLDLLDGTESLARWLSEANLTTRAAVVSPRDFAAAKRIRAALRDVAGSLADGKPVRRASVVLIDDELRRGRGALSLSQQSGKLSFAFEPEPSRAHDPRFLLARSAATFLASADPSRIHRCGGTNCILFFYDATKSGTRRWCSMAGCGNRMKAATHYQRKQAR